MLNENEIKEVKKFFLKSLKLSLNEYQSRRNLLRTARNLPNDEISLQVEKYNIPLNDMRIIYAAFQTATTDTQNKIQVTQDNIDEITDTIHTYHNQILPELLNGYNPQVSLLPWRIIKKNIDILDNAIKIEGFTEKYSTHLKVAGIGVSLLGLAALGFFALVNGDIDASAATSATHTI